MLAGGSPFLDPCDWPWGGRKERPVRFLLPVQPLNGLGGHTAPAKTPVCSRLFELWLWIGSGRCNRWRPAGQAHAQEIAADGSRLGQRGDDLNLTTAVGQTVTST